MHHPPASRSAAHVALVIARALIVMLTIGALPLSHARAQRADTLINPPLLRNVSTKPGVVEVEITAAPARLTVVPGHVTSAYAYNGMVPGPTLEAHEGDHVIIHFHNALPEPTTIHWHGVHLPAVMDGSPFEAVPPGGHYDYVFTVPRGSAGTYWYHPHPDMRSSYQVAMGLFGAFIVRAADDPIPASVHEKLLILSDNRFNPDGSVAFADSGTTQGDIDDENGREGNVLLVNGQIMPTLRIRSGEVQRWRVINASGARVFRVGIPGQTMLAIGTDGGLFEKPVEAKDILLANSERAEVLVRGTGAPGSRVQVQDLPYDRYMPQTRPADWDVPKPLLTLQYSDAPPTAPAAIPATLRRIPVLDTTKATAHRVIVLSQGLLDNRTMDMHRVDTHARLGAVEVWEVENVVGMDHPFHLHGFQFQVLDRDGVPEPYRSWKDVVNVPKHSAVRFIVHYADFPGKWMYHCHILLHEDHGMMAVLEVQ